MPDQDIFYRRFACGWANPARKICKGADPAIAANAAAVALQKDLSTLGGIPQLETLYELLLTLQAEGSEKALVKAFDQIRCFERSSNNRDLSGKLGESCRQICIELANGRSDIGKKRILRFPFPDKYDFANRICQKFMEYRLHSKIDLMGRSDGKQNYWHEPSYRRAYKSYLLVYIEKIARSLIKDPSFTNPPVLRRPKRLKQIEQKRLTTEELINQPIQLLG